MLRSLMPWAALGLAMPAAAGILSVTPSSASVERYKPLIVAVTVAKDFQNGYDPDQIKVDLMADAPGGAAIDQPCFYKADQGSDAAFECRFAPRLEGSYAYAIVAEEKGIATRSQAFTLTSTPGSGDGFLRPDTGAAGLFGFRYDSGKLWRGIGENVAWEPGGFTYATVLPRLKGLGCNMIRIWHCPWHMPIEWNSAPTQFNAKNSEAMDRLVSLAEANGIYLMVMLNDYREYSEQWNSDPYSTAKGGPCATAKEFFTSAAAKALYKKKLRYYAARWGYSPNIQSWEFFNEIDNAVGPAGIDPKALAAWHDEMAAEFHRVDPYRHLVTSSVSWVYEQMWASPSIDFTQSHLYGPSNKISKLPSEIKRYVDGFRKPYVCGEFARRWEAATTEPSGNYRIDLHYGMWLGMFQSTPIVPMTWWWDSHFRWGDDFVFQSAAGFHNDIVTKAGTAGLAKLPVTATLNQQAGGLWTGNTGYVWASNYAGAAAANGVVLTVSGLRAQDVDYRVEWYDTWNGGFTLAPGVKSHGGALAIDAGNIAAGQDKALRLTNLSDPPAGLAGPALAAAPPSAFRVSRAGARLIVRGGFRAGTLAFELRDLSGRALEGLRVAREADGVAELEWTGPRGGVALLRLSDGAHAAAELIPL